MRSLAREQLLTIFGLSSGAFDALQRAGHVALAFGTPSPAMPGRYCDLDLAALAIADALAPTLGRPIAKTIVLVSSINGSALSARPMLIRPAITFSPLVGWVGVTRKKASANCL